MNDKLQQMIRDLYEPPEGRLQALRDRLMASLPARRAIQRTPAGKRMIMNVFRVSGATGIAAAILLAVYLLIGSHTVPVANAAETLKQAATATASYKGWVNVRLTKSGGQSGEFHLNTEDGTAVLIEAEPNGVRSVTYASPSQHLVMRYDSSANAIVREANTPHSIEDPASVAHRLLSPKWVAEQIQETAERKDMTVTQDKDGAFDRFTILPLDPNTAPWKRTVLLVEAKTKLLRKETVLLPDNGIFEVVITYDDPHIGSIYDAGVPKDAKIVEAPAAGPPAQPSR